MTGDEVKVLWWIGGRVGGVWSHVVGDVDGVELIGQEAVA